MSAQKKATVFRGDLEGIRGIALIIILFTHLIEWPTGGFVALDTFFVLSGYLITGLLLREYRITGTISLNGFYRRRVRRLMPSAMLVLVATVTAALVIFISSRAISTIWDAIWSLLLVSNWNFAIGGTDYFATSLPQSPLLHYWSLSVEEQFYLFWPAIVLGLLLLGAGASRSNQRRRQSRPVVSPAVRPAERAPAPLTRASNRAAIRDSAPRSAASVQGLRPLIIGIVVIGVLSFAWGVIQADLNPQVSYLSTLTRTWELAVGALLCFAAPLAAKLPVVLRPVLAWSGFTAIIVCAFVYTPSLHYPGFWCLVPVVGTVFIIFAGIAGPSHLVITTNPVSRFLGKISYTTYLWHWPIFIFTGVLVGKASPIYLFATIPVSLLVATLTTRFIEDPIRHSRWLEPKKRTHHSGSAHRRERRLKIGFSTAGVAVALALVAVIVFAPRGGDSGLQVASAIDVNGPARSTGAPAAAPAAPAAESTVAVEQQKLTEAITAGLNTADWPGDLNPSLDDLNQKAWAPQWTQDGCLDTSAQNAADCVYGDASLPKTAVLLGDSAAISYMPGLEPALNSLGYRIHVLTHAQCPFANVQVLGASDEPAPGFPGACDDSRQWSVDETVALNPDLVVITDGEVEIGGMVIQGTDARLAALQNGMADSLQKLGSVTGDVVLLSGPPASVALSDCATRLNHPSDCTRFIDDLWFKQLKGLQNVASAAVTSGAAKPVTVVDTSMWYCSDRSACPAIADRTPIRADSLHLTATYSAGLEPMLKATFAGLTAP